MQPETDCDKIDSVHCENENMKSIVYGLEQEINELESRSRRENLRFFGLAEDEHDSHEQSMSTILKTLNEFLTSKS